MLLPCQTQLLKALPGSWELSFVFSCLVISEWGKEGGSCICLKSLVFHGGGGRGQSWGRSEMESPSASSEKPSWVAADSLGEHDSPEPLN